MAYSYEKHPKEIIEKLLEYHDIKILQAILNSKARRKDPKGNNYFKIATDVYLLQRTHDSKLEWAIDQVAEEANISDKTVKNHLTKFRKEIKNEIDKLQKQDNYIPLGNETVADFIKEYIEEVWRRTYHPYPPTYRGYKDIYDYFLREYTDKREISDIPF